MNVVYFSPRTGSTYAAKKIAQQENIEYAGEVMYSGPFVNESESSQILSVLNKQYFDSLLSGLNQYKNSVIKITPSQITSLCNENNISLSLFTKLVKPHATKNYFCVRNNLPDQVKSFYALMMLYSSAGKNYDSFEEYAHASWGIGKGKRLRVLHNDEVLTLAKETIKNDLVMLSEIYNELPEHKKQLLVYEDWADPNDKYKRDMTFDTTNFDVDYRLSDFFDVRR